MMVKAIAYFKFDSGRTIKPQKLKYASRREVTFVHRPGGKMLFRDLHRILRKCKR